MARSTGPIVAAAAVVIGNAVLVHDESWSDQTRVAVAGVIAAMGLSLIERPFPSTAEALAWTALIAVLFVRAKPNVPAPLESLRTWYYGGN